MLYLNQPKKDIDYQAKVIIKNLDDAFNTISSLEPKTNSEKLQKVQTLISLSDDIENILNNVYVALENIQNAEDNTKILDLIKLWGEQKV